MTGDAVVLGLQPARLPSRALALLIDLVVVWSVYLIVMVGVVLASTVLDDAAVAALSVVAFLLVLVGAPIAVETLSRGRSLGKLACGLRVVRDDGGPVRFRHALVRGAMGVVEIMLSFGVIACLASLVSARGRRVGDVFAGTLVVRERVPAQRAAWVVPPPPAWLAGRFTGLDLSGVPDDLWLAIRQYLTRMRQLDPAVSWSVAVRLAGDLASRTGAPVPDGVPPAAYLAAVVHERQGREVRRAHAAAARASADAAAERAARPGADTAAATGPTAGAQVASGPAAAVPEAAAGPGRQEERTGPAPTGADAPLPPAPGGGFAPPA